MNDFVGKTGRTLLSLALFFGFTACKPRQTSESKTLADPNGEANGASTADGTGCIEAYWHLMQQGTTTPVTPRSLDGFLSGSPGSGRLINGPDFVAFLGSADPALGTLLNCRETPRNVQISDTAGEHLIAALALMNSQRRFYKLPDGEDVDAYRMLIWTMVFEGLGRAAAGDDPDRAIEFSIPLAQKFLEGFAASPLQSELIVTTIEVRTFVQRAVQQNSFEQLQRVMVEKANIKRTAEVFKTSAGQLWNLHKLHFLLHELSYAANWERSTCTVQMPFGFQDQEKKWSKLGSCEREKSSMREVMAKFPFKITTSALDGADRYFPVSGPQDAPSP